MKSKFLLTVFILFFFPHLHGQQINIKLDPLSEREGLNATYISSIMQDHLGFIWIGSVGIYKYDGYSLTHHLDLPGCKNCPPIANYYIKKIMEDDIGLIWILTMNGIKIYDPEKERTVLIASSKISDDYNWSYVYANDIIKDSHGNIWAPAYNGLVKVSYNSRIKKPVTRDMIFNNCPDSIFIIEYLSISPDIQSDKNKVLSLYEDIWGDIWIGSMDGLYLLKNGSGTFLRIDSGENNETRLTGGAVYDILQDDENTFWIAASKGLSRITNVKNALHNKSHIEISSLVFSGYMEGTGEVVSLLKDRQNNLLIGTSRDLYRMHINDLTAGGITFEPIYQIATDSHAYLYGKDFRAIMQDKSGVLFMGQNYSGVMKSSLGKSVFASYVGLVKNNFSSDETKSIIEDQHGNIWIGNTSGLYKISASDHKVAGFDQGLAKKEVSCIIQTDHDILMLGLNKGIMTFNILTGKFEDPINPAVSQAADNLRKIQVYSLLKDGNRVYISSACGIFVYNCKNRKVLQTTINNDDSITDKTNRFRSLLKSNDGDMWTASDRKGICRINYNEENGTLSLIPFVSSDLSVFNILDCANVALHQDKNGILWLGNGHLQRINLKTGEIRTLKLSDNIDFAGVASILEDDHENLWLGTGFGLCRFNLKTEKSVFFSDEDGLPFLNHKILSAFENSKGLMYFGGEGGFYSFHPDSIKMNNTIPPIVITDFRLFNKSVKIDSSKKAILTRNISYTSSIELQYDQNDLSFEFAALDYNQPLKNKYAYKLEGYQNTWNETDAKNHVAAFTNLDPGVYTFRVKGSNNDGIWNEQGASLKIIIHPPWYTTPLAWVSYALFFILALTAFIRWRIWKLKKEKTELENLVYTRTKQVERQKSEIITQKDLLEIQNQKITELDQIRSRFFSNISHEFRTPLSLIQGPVEELLDNPRRNEKERGKLNIVYRNARRMLNLVNQLLDISRIDNTKMKLGVIESDVMKYLRAITAAFNSLAETKDISYRCNIPEEQRITWFDPDKCEKIVSNLLSNAFKFTPKGGRILFTADYGLNESQNSITLHFSVQDNGPGIPAESLEKIFDRFYQVEESIRKETGGTGIGLSLARDMARLMHGDITVTSEYGKGSIFSVEFPLGKEHLNPNEYNVLNDLPESVTVIPLPGEQYAGLPEKEEGLLHKKPILLLVEDNIDIRVQLADNFQSKYAIKHASDGVVGLKKATEILPDLIITDLMMPFMDGIEMCRRLKTDERTSHIPVIMLTAKVTVEDKIAGLQTGADDYVSKPFHLAELKARVDNLIEQRRRLRERFSREVNIQLSDITVTDIDEKFLIRAVALVEKHLHDEHFDLQNFREEMNMSSSTLFRKLQALTNQSPTEFIRTLRLKRAASLLSQNFGNVTQVSLEVGFNNLSYFNKSFKKLFGVSPTEYSNSKKVP